MGGRFLDEEPVPAVASRGGHWLDDDGQAGADPAAVGGRFMDDEGTPAKPEEIAQRFLNPDYTPTRAEFDIWDAAEKRKPFLQPGEWPAKIGAAAEGLWNTIAATPGGIKRAITSDEDFSPVQSLLEGAARGTVRDLTLARKLLELPNRLLTGGHINEDQYIAQKIAEVNEAKFRQTGIQANSKLVTREDLDPRGIEMWKREFKEKYLPDTDFQNFLEQRQTVRDEIGLATGKTNIVPDLGMGKPIPELAETSSLVLSPSVAVPFGAATKPAGSLVRSAAARGLQAVGRGTEIAGETVGRVATIPERLAGAGAKAFTGSEAAAEKVRDIVSKGSIGATVASPFVAVPGLTETAIATTGLKAASKTLQGIGDAAQAGGRAAAEGPSRWGLMERIARDADAPEWLRRGALATRWADPALSVGGTVAKGAAEGAAIGGALGALADGEEGFTAGLGSGLVMGGVAAPMGRALAGKGYREQLENLDIARWINRKSPEEMLNLRGAGLSRADALKLADTERMARGAVGRSPGTEIGDVQFRYVNDVEFRELFGGIAKGAEVIQGDRPAVFVNTGYKGARSMFHETMEALMDLEGFSPQKQQLGRLLFDQTTSDGTPITRGLYNAADLAAFESQYRSRLGSALRDQWDLNYRPQPGDAPDVVARKTAALQARMMREVMAESFASLIQSGGARGFRTIRQRVADSLLLAPANSKLGLMRRGLEAVGVKFNASGDPSELFVKNGRPITNTPAVDAALRDYIRAKDAITRRMNAGDDGESPQTVVKPQDLVSKNNAGLIDTFKDNDLLARNSDGSVKMLGGVPVLLSEGEINRVQAKRVEAMLAALDAVPDLGDVGAVRKQDNGAYVGKSFSDRQLAALLALPDDLLSPSMKAKLRELNALALQDGQQIILDYNAALKSKRYSSGISNTVRAGVPLVFEITKAGNFLVKMLDTTHFFRKLGEWRRAKPRAFEAWNGDVDAFLRDVFTYLDNHANGRRGDINLDADAAVAVHKKNVINNFFNVPQGDGVNPIALSTKAGKDNLIRSRRFDRINRVTPGAGDKFPVRYDLLKANYLPGERQPVELPLRGGGMVRGPVNFLPAHHGTPHKVDKFTTDKIGTGEGAQVYGWGLYFAENPEVAKQYHNQLNYHLESADGRRMTMGGARAASALQRLRDAGGDYAKAFNQIQDELSSASITSDIYADAKLLEEWQKQGLKPKQDGGGVYTVDLKVKPDEWLDWDKPLSEQSEKVQKALAESIPDLKRHLESFRGSPWDVGDQRAFDHNLTDGSSLYKFIGSRQYERMGSKEWARVQDKSRAASEHLSSLGIKGIRYLDQGSRLRFTVTDHAGEVRLKTGDKWQAELEAANGLKDGGKPWKVTEDHGTHNYVVFSDKDIEITHENGQPVNLKAQDRGSPSRSTQETKFLPAPDRGSPSRSTPSPAAVLGQLTAQAQHNFAQRTGLPRMLAADLGARYFQRLDEKLNRKSSAPRTAQVSAVAAAMSALTPAEVSGLHRAIQSGGVNGAQAYLDRLAFSRLVKTRVAASPLALDASALQRAMTANQVKESAPVELIGTKFSRYSNALVSQSPVSGKWRLTWFNEFSETGELTPGGHKEYPSREAALAAARKLEYVEKP